MRRLEVKPFREMDPVPIGVVFLAVMAILLLLSFNLDKLPFTSGTSYSAAFARADGLRKGDRVMVGGVVVGKVESVELEGTHVRVGFSITSGGVELGDRTTASIQIATLLGNKYLALAPAGAGQWSPDREIPLDRTASTYDVVPAFEDLGKTLGDLDTHQLARALDTMAATFKDSPESVRAMLGGLSRLSQTIASRDDELTSLLQRSETVTRVLADRRGDLTQIFGDGDRLLQMMQRRHAVIDALLRNTARMSTQLSGLVHDNQASLAPTLRHVHNVLSLLNAHQHDLDQIIKELYVFVRGEVDATGSGPWFDGSAINAFNPFQTGGAAAYPNHPRTLGDLLGVKQAERAFVRGHR